MYHSLEGLAIKFGSAGSQDGDRPKTWATETKMALHSTWGTVNRPHPFADMWGPMLGPGVSSLTLGVVDELRPRAARSTANACSRTAGQGSA